MSHTPILDGNIVVNVIALEDGAIWQPPEGQSIGTPGGRIGDTWDGTQYVSPYVPPPPVTSDDINAERDRRMAGGFTFGGNTYQSDAISRQRIADAAIEAIEAIMLGVEGGNLRWCDPDADFTWRTADNAEVPVDAPTMVEIHKAARAHEAFLIKRAQDLKAAPPGDYTDDSHWV
jgi:hypothetical protein